MSEKWVIHKSEISFIVEDSEGTKGETFFFENLSKNQFQEVMERVVNEAVQWFRDYKKKQRKEKKR